MSDYTVSERQLCFTVYDTSLSCLGIVLQQIDSLIHNNLADIVVELLMTLYEGGGTEGDRGELKCFIG